MIYIVNEPFESLCCGRKFVKGMLLTIDKQTSPNRLQITEVATTYGHKVKRSTFHRCCVQQPKDQV